VSSQSVQLGPPVAQEGVLDSDRRTALLAIYAVERQDDSTALTVAFAITTTGLTYVIAATAFFADHCRNSTCDGKIPTWLPLVAPAIAVAFVGFLILNVAATRMRSVHIQRLENAIRISVSSDEIEPSFHTDAGLVYRPDKPFEKPGIRAVFAVVTIVSYVVIMLTLMGFTWFIFFFASGPWTIPKYVAAVGYGVFELVQIVGFAWPLRHERFVYERPENALPH
jgi:hypothetical protein